jgi:hypothetical protein
MPRMTSRGGGTRDDLGARLLAAHPRSEQWRQLDVTVANLTFDQLDRMGRLIDADTSRGPLRTQLIEGIVDRELLGRLGSRWVRWAATFGLPQPGELHTAPGQILRHPYTLADTGAVTEAYLCGVLAVFDAGLAIAAAPIDAAGAAAYEVLANPWRRVCLPCRFTPATAYGPHTQPALAVLREARSLWPEAVRKICRARTEVDPAQWNAARDEVEDSARAWGYPLRPQCLFWEAVPAAEDAANESPTDPCLADALWAAAATQAFAGRLRTATNTVLASPWRGAGLTLPT